MTTTMQSPAPSSQAPHKPRLEFGLTVLTACSRCGRRKQMPGAECCPDCAAVSRLVTWHAHELERMYRKWSKGKPTGPDKLLANDAVYQSFETLGKVMQAYGGWLSELPFVQLVANGLKDLK